MSWSAPFCGPNTVAAPIGPSSGCSTSVAAISSTSASRALAASSPPRASIIPRPPSVQELPPSPTTIRPAPASHRGGDQLSDPSAVCGQRGLHCRRAAEQRQPAGLRTLDVGRARVTVVENPVGVHLVGQRTADRAGFAARRRGPPARRRIPGPPSDCGASVSSSPGRALRQPSAIASAACTAVRLSP